jgi:anti-sigma regulatory factor (Ser/Thr protein kinase)
MTHAHLELVLPAARSSIPAIRHAVADAAVELHAEAAAVDAVKLAVTEAVTNVVLHAYGEEGGVVRVAVEPGTCTLVASVADDGGGVGASPDRAGGYGLALMRALSRSCDVTTGDSGTSVRMVFSLAGEQTRP